MINTLVRPDDLTSQELDFDYPVVNIGCHSENDVVLTGTGILPFHATVHLQEGQFHFVALGGISAIKIDGVQLKATPVKLSPMQRVEIGGYTLAFQNKGGPKGLHVSVSRSAEAGSVLTGQSALIPVTSPTGDSPILVNVLSRQLEVAVGQTAVYELEIINAGPIVASFSVSTQGLPEAWIKVEPAMVNLYEGQRATVHISVTPPRDPGSKAGSHTLQAIVSSSNYASQPVQTQLTLNILPYYEFTIGNLSPKQQRIYWRKRSGIVKLPISNTGNSEADFNVTAFDDENGCSFDFQVSKEVERSRQATINIPAGQSISMPIEVTPLKRPIAALRSKDYHFTATTQIAQQSSLSQTVSGAVTSVPLIGWWTIVLTLALILIGLFILVQPRIYSFEVAAGKDIIEQGDTTKLDWSVSPFATTLSLSNYDQAINRGQVSQTIAPTQSTTYELAASNWLSGLFGLDQKRTQTILVVPPKPVINVFEVDRTSVPEGTTVKLRWSVSKAEKALLTVDKVVYELKAEQFSGEQEVALTKDSLVTLEAINASGSELRSYFIKIVQPKITVNSFVVWVRPAKTAAAGAPSFAALDVMGKGNGLLALAPAAHVKQARLEFPSPAAVPPDPNFPERYVGLVPDKAADLGYRVEFYQPDRELSKGEQIMIQWDIEGADNDKLQIAPFTDALPGRGAQPYFPQESMNFVMTAKSGKLERLFMLPVKVFDGTPPTAPKIDFFKASPTTLKGSGKVQFTWAVSGEWTRIQLFTEKKVIGDYLTPQGFKSINVTASGTYILTAWNGNLSSSSPIDITVNPSLIPIDLAIKSIYVDSPSYMVGQKILVTVVLGAIPSGSPNPTGKVTVTDGYATCDINLPALSCDLTFSTPGDKQLTAIYAGDTIYLQASSPPFPASSTINVQAAEVELIPRYFENITDTSIPDITATGVELPLDKGVHILVEVRPKNVSIPDDDKSKVNVSICDQDAGGNIIQSTCIFLSSGTAQPATETSFNKVVGKFYVDIVISQFTTPGTHAFLFRYYHDANTIVPTSYTQNNVKLGFIKFHLYLDICTTDPDALTDCQLGVPDPSNITLTFKLRSENPNADIFSNLPTPPANAFTFSTTTAGVTWDPPCSIESPSGVFLLKCTVKGLTSSATGHHIDYTFDNTVGKAIGYYMGDAATNSFADSFDLIVLENTKVVINNMTGVKVGEKIQVTGAGGYISVLDSSNSPVPSTTGNLTLEDTSGNQGIGCATTTNCTQDATTGVITIKSLDTNYIYFKHAGPPDTTIKAVFIPDPVNGAEYLGSENTKSVSVGKQDGIKAIWKYYSGGAYINWDAGAASLAVGNVLQIRVVLDAPANFYPDALVGRQLTGKFLEQDKLAYCSLGMPPGGATGEYLSEIMFDTATTPPLYADFTLSCTTTDVPFDITTELAFINTTTDTVGDDFAFDTIYNKVINIKQADSSHMDVTLCHYPYTTSCTNLIEDIDTNKLHAGEKYQLVFKLYTFGGSFFSWGSGYKSADDIFNDYINQDNSVNITLPGALLNIVDWSNSTCDTSGVLKVDLNSAVDRYIDSHDVWIFGLHWGYVTFALTNSNAPCDLVFSSSADVNDNIGFQFTSHNNIYTVSSSYPTIGVEKQDITSIGFNPAGPTYTGFVGINQPFTLTVGTASGTTVPPIPSSVTTFSPLLSANATCGGTTLTLSNYTINSPNTAGFTLTAPSSACTGTLAVNYNGSSFFNASPSGMGNITLNFNQHAASFGSVTVGGNPFSFNTTSNKAKTATDYAFVIPVSDGDGAGHTNIPDGTVKVSAWNNGTSAALVAGTDYQITCTPACTYDGSAYPVTLNASGRAVFTVRFLTVPTVPANPIVIKYEYSGSAVFSSISSASTSEFNIQASP